MINIKNILKDIDLENYKKEFINFMIKSDVLTFGNFMTKSGRQTPYFINTGKYKTGAQLSKLGEFYAYAIKENFDIKNINTLFGPAYKGIPIVTATAMKLKELFDINISFVFNRKEIKDHGEGGSFIGTPLQAESKVLIVEDVTTAGTSIYETVPLLKSEADIQLKGLLVSVDRKEKAPNSTKTALKKLSKDFEMKTSSIVNIYDIIKHLYNRQINGIIHINDTRLMAIQTYLNEFGVTED